MGKAAIKGGFEDADYEDKPRSNHSDLIEDCNPMGETPISRLSTVAQRHPRKNQSRQDRGYGPAKRWYKA